MPVNPYDDHKVSLRRPHGYSDVDIVRVLYTRRKANVTEALKTVLCVKAPKILETHFFHV